MERIPGEFAEYLRRRLLLPERGVGDYLGWARAFLVFARTRRGSCLVFSPNGAPSP